MFGFFKKKGEEPEETAREQKASQKTANKQLKELAAQFLPEELTILAVTGPTALAAARPQRKNCGRPPSV